MHVRKEMMQNDDFETHQHKRKQRHFVIKYSYQNFIFKTFNFFRDMQLKLYKLVLKINAILSWVGMIVKQNEK